MSNGRYLHALKNPLYLNANIVFGECLTSSNDRDGLAKSKSAR